MKNKQSKPKIQSKIIQCLSEPNTIYAIHSKQIPKDVTKWILLNTIIMKKWKLDKDRYAYWICVSSFIKLFMFYVKGILQIIQVQELTSWLKVDGAIYE